MLGDLMGILLYKAWVCPKDLPEDLGASSVLLFTADGATAAATSELLLPTYTTFTQHTLPACAPF